MDVFYYRPGVKKVLHKRKRWNGHSINICCICQNKIVYEFIYGRIKKCTSMWLVMCPGCSTNHSVGLGFDKGYLYRIQVGGKYYRM